MSYIIMHESTLKYLIDQGCDTRIHIGACDRGTIYEYWIAGKEVIFCNFLKPTIMEPDYVFPSNRFITYEQKDREWCEPLGIGRAGIKQVGEIYFISNKGTTSFFPTVKKKKKYYSAAEILYGIK